MKSEFMDSPDPTGKTWIDRTAAVTPSRGGSAKACLASAILKGNGPVQGAQWRKSIGPDW